MGQSQPPFTDWCLADENEIGICEMAEVVGNPAYQTFMIPGGQHGNMMHRPGLTPDAMQTILDFLAQMVGP
jgi:putative intracellular protease/amidase